MAARVVSGDSNENEGDEQQRSIQISVSQESIDEHDVQW
jgi:hypothetical protein